MKVIISIISFLIVSSCYLNSQTFAVYENDTINRIDSNNKKSGKWLIFKNNSKTQILQEGKYFDGKKHGLWKTYYSDGNLKSEITYDRGTKKGYAKIFFENGNIAEEGTWNVNKWIGKYKSYYKNGKLSYVWNYNETGTRSGYQQYFYENGNIKIEGEWLNGKEKGIIKDYYSNGSLRTEKVYNDGKIDMNSVKQYKQQEKDAVTVSNNVQNKKDTSDSLKIFNGNGYHVFYNIHKKIEKEGSFIKGILMDGKQHIYNSEGILIKTLIYEKGKVINQMQPNIN